MSSGYSWVKNVEKRIEMTVTNGIGYDGIDSSHRLWSQYAGKEPENQLDLRLHLAEMEGWNLEKHMRHVMEQLGYKHNGRFLRPPSGLIIAHAMRRYFPPLLNSRRPVKGEVVAPAGEGAFGAYCDVYVAKHSEDI